MASKEQLHLIWIAITGVDVIKLPLVDIFALYVQPADLYKNIEGTSLIAGKNKLQSDQLEICFILPPDLPDYNKFDFSLLYTLLRHLCPTVRPSQGWGKNPNSTDLFIGDDIERLRLFRNKVYAHVTSSVISKDEFEVLWGELKSVLQRLQIFLESKGCQRNYKQELTKIKDGHYQYEDLEKYKSTLATSLNLLGLTEKAEGLGSSMEAEEKKVNRGAKYDVPTAKLLSVEHVGSETELHCLLSSYPSPEKFEWQKSIDGNTFYRIDISNPKYEAISSDAYHLYLRIKKPSFGSQRYYRIIVWNKIGKITSNTIFLTDSDQPSILCIHATCNIKDSSVKLRAYTTPHKMLKLSWGKDGKPLNKHGSEEKYLGGNIDQRALVIRNPNSQDTGFYEIHAIYENGFTVCNKVKIDAPVVLLERQETRKDGSYLLKVTIQSNPAPCSIEWSVKKKTDTTFKTIKTRDAEYRGTSISYPHPVLKVQRSELYGSSCFKIEVNNVIGITTKVFAGFEQITDLWHLHIQSPVLTCLLNSVTEDIQSHRHFPSSFAKQLLTDLQMDQMISEVKSLSTKVELSKTFEKVDHNQHGKIYVSNVSVVYEKKKLCVIQKDPNQWRKFLQANFPYDVGLILIHSKSIDVMKSKILVYKEYKNHIDSKGLFLQHILEDYDDISKLSAYKKISSMCEIFELLCRILPADGLDAVVVKAVDRVLTPKNIKEICHRTEIRDGGNYIGSVNDYSYRCFSSFTVQRIKRSLVYEVLQQIGHSLVGEIYFTMSNGVDSPCRRKLESALHFLDIKIHEELNEQVKSLMNELANLSNPMTVGDFFFTLITTVDVNSKEWRSHVGREIYRKVRGDKKRIVELVSKLVADKMLPTAKDLESVCKNLKKAKENLQPNSVNELIEAWQKRQNLYPILATQRFPSVLKFIVGYKNRKLTIRVYLTHDDSDAKEYFRNSDQLPKEAALEFVDVSRKSKKAYYKSVDHSSSLIEKHDRESLGQTIENHGERIYANHSSIVGLGMGVLFSEPCIILYSLDKKIIPLGEKPLPRFLDGWPCFIQVDIVMFGACFDCRQIAQPNPGCCIGIPSHGIGSVGFLVKKRGSASETAGFLTAAHVASENWTDLYYKRSFLSELVQDHVHYQIVHPLLPDDNNFQIIGRVIDSFCGKWGPDGTGIDAAYVQNYAPIRGEIRELSVSDGRNLVYDRSMKVLKRGGTTGETEGYLVGDSLSVRIHQVCYDPESEESGLFFYFPKCFAIESINCPFFEPGDSGSGVYLMENGVPTQPLGIAFAKLPNGQTTAVCRLNEIVDAFNLFVYQNEDDMEAN